MPNQPFITRKPAGEQGQSTVDRVLTVARRNLGLLLVCALLVPAAALAYSLTQESRYTASASLLFRDPGFDAQVSGTPLFSQDNDPQRVAATNLQLVSLRQISERTARGLGGSGLSADDVAAKVSIAPEGASDVIKVNAEDTSPARAARLANTFAQQYIVFRREADRTKIREAQTLVEQELAALDPAELAGVDGQDLARRARELEILTSLQTGNAELVQTATPPSGPSAPQPVRNVALGILLGLLLGAGLTVLREQLNRRLKDSTEAADLLGLPILAMIPASRAIAKMGEESLTPAGAESDAFRMLRTNLRYFNVDRQVKSILVTSAAPHDGKTTVSWNLAVSEARAGNRVLYLEADLRRPSLAQQLRVASPRKGLSLTLAGMANIVDEIQVCDGVDVLFAGALPPNPAELIESERMRDLIRWGEEHYDRVIIDTPPAAVVSDAVPLATGVSGVVVVVRIQRTRRDSAENLREQLVNIGAPVLGLVVNGVPFRAQSYYYRQPPEVEAPSAGRLAGVASVTRRARATSQPQDQQKLRPTAQQSKQSS